MHDSKQIGQFQGYIVDRILLYTRIYNTSAVTVLHVEYILTLFRLIG